MLRLYPRNIIGLLIGVIIGLVFPIIASWWLLFVILAAIIVIELNGQWGFGDHWVSYRFSSFILNLVPLILGLVGIFLASGKIGALLIYVGQLISR